MVPDIDPRLLRRFVAVAHELHIGRAAAGLFVAQQAVSRDIARLERELGVQLFVRSTRHIALTPEGARLLPRAEKLLALHDRIVKEVSGSDRTLLVDVMHDRSTAAQVLTRARALAPELAMEGRFHGGFTAAMAELLSHRLDVAFGRGSGGDRHFPQQLSRRLVRLEPLALLLPDDHPLAELPAIPMAAIAGRTIDTSAGNPQAPEWVELGAELLGEYGGTPAPEHHPGMAAVAAAGTDETARHLRSTGWPILTKVDGPDIRGAVVRPLTDPVPLYPWTMVHHRDLRHRGLEALNEAVGQLARANDWYAVPERAWLAPADRDLVESRLDQRTAPRGATSRAAMPRP